MALQISSPETFTGTSPGKTVTATRLNNHVNGATILPGAINEQTTGTPALADFILWMNAAGNALKKVTLTNLFGIQVVDAAAGTGSLRTLGNSGNKAAPGATTPGLAIDNTFTGRNTIKHIGFAPVYGDAGAPTVAIVGTNLGTGGSPAVILVAGSTDSVGQIQMTTGNTAIATGANLVTLTFGQTFIAAPIVLIAAVGVNAVVVQGTTKSITQNAVATTGFSLAAGSVALAINTTYIFGYIAAGT